MKKIWKLLVVLCLSTTMFACSNNSEQAVEKDEKIVITDQSGREVTLDKPAEKVASAYYIATTTIIGLGAEDKLVGVEMKAETREIYKQAAPQLLDLPALGNKKMFNVETCAEADPDVVFLPVSLNSYIDQLEELDIQVVLLNPETNESFDEAIEIIAKVCGVEEKAKEYFTYREELFKKYIKTETDSSQSVYFAGMELLEAASDDMFQGELIKSAKGVNALSEKGQSSWMRINVETLLASNPAYIFLENGGIGSDVVYNDSSLSELDAVKNNQVYVFPSTLETWDTPNLSYCLGTLWTYAILHPEEVSMDVVKEEANKFYNQFYDIDVEDFGL